MIAIVIATAAAVWFTTASGLTGGTSAAKPAADQSYDQVEKLRGAGAISAGSTDNGFYAQHDVASLPFLATSGSTADEFYAQHDVASLPFIAASGTPSMTSGTFHPGNATDPGVKRDRVGGP